MLWVEWMRKGVFILNPSIQPIHLRQVSLFILLISAVWFIVSIKSYDQDHQLVIQPVVTDVFAYTTTDLQLFLIEETGSGFQQATVTATFELEESLINVLFHHVEDGLYEGEARFDQAGLWRGSVEAKTFSKKILRLI